LAERTGSSDAKHRDHQQISHPLLHISLGPPYAFSRAQEGERDAPYCRSAIQVPDARICRAPDLHG
jgi:hypothetical protein